LLSLTLAQKLKETGLEWTPSVNDLFVVPDRGLDDVVFVLSNMMARVERIRGYRAVTFHGVVEWALDYILFSEVVWLPTEEQLRTNLVQHLLGEPEPVLILSSTFDGYRCEIPFRGQKLTFEAFDASETYAVALLHILTETRAAP
jgi:hypothetical protein